MSYSLFHAPSAALSPADGARNIMSLQGNTYLSSLTGQDYHFVIGQDGTITDANITMFVQSTLSSGEDMTVGIVVQGVDNVIATNIETSANINKHTITGLNIDVDAGDDVWLYTTNPTWATNPTNVRPSVHLIVDTGDGGGGTTVDLQPMIDANVLMGGALLFILAMSMIMFYFRRK